MTWARGAQPQPPGGKGPAGAPAWSPFKAVGVLVVAVALGVYLVTLGTGHGASASPVAAHTTSPPKTSPPSTTVPPSTTAPTAATSPTTASSGAQPSATVKVLVANASQTNGIATYFSGKLAAAGWGTLTPVTATTAETTSTIYYATGRQQDALAVAAALGLPSSSVKPIAGVVPVAGITQADIVVVAGNDLAAKVPASSG